jgi:abhydrolase domain-containing protein 17
MRPLVRHLVMVPLTFVVVGYCVLLLMAWRSDGMIFQPQPSSYRDRDLVAPFEIFKLHSGAGSDARTITALYLRNAAARFTLLMSHGNAEDIGENRELYEEYGRRGFAVFAYDYGGYGTSTGVPTERGVNEDERAAWDFMVGTLQIAPSQIIVHGTSVGCGAAVELAAQLSRMPVDGRPAALILRSPFASAFTVLTRVRIVPWDKFDNAKRIGEVQMPVLVVHGTADEVIPLRHGERVFHNAAPVGDSDVRLTREDGKQHLWIPGAGHNDIFVVAAKMYFDKLEAFARGIPGGSSQVAVHGSQ